MAAKASRARDETSWLTELIRSMADGVIATDKRGRIIFMNPSAESITGFTFRDAILKPLRDIFRAAGVSGAIVSPRSLRRSKISRQYSGIIMVNRNGERRIVDAILTPVAAKTGRISGAVMVIHDVTTTIVVERTSLDKKKIASIGSMARSIGLEFSNWIGVISGHASAIADNLIPNTRAHEEASRILDVAKQANVMTKRLLSIARAGSLRDQARVEKVILSDVIMDSLSLVDRTFAERGIVIRAKCSRTPQYVQVDAGQLLDCLISLYIRASDRMPDGGTINIRISSVSENNKQFVVVRIRDSGHKPAAKAAESDVIDNDAVKTEQFDLMVIEGWIRKWGGSVKVRAGREDGSSVRIILPRMEAPVVRAGTSARPVHETILLADDRSDMRTAASKILKSAGYRVIETENSADAVSVFRKRSGEIHLALIDAIMPGINGKNLLREMLAIDPTARIVMTSGFSRDFLRAYLEVGAWGYVQKPFEHSQLLATVRKMLEENPSPASAEI